MFYCKKTINQSGMCFLILITACLIINVKQPYAETINIQSHLSVITRQDKIDVRLIIKNKGNTAAYDIVSRIRFLGELKESDLIHFLSSGCSETISMVFDLQKNIEGDYPLIVEIQFHDMNLYPFYSLRCSPIHIRSQKLTSRLAVGVSDVELSAQNSINVKIANEDNLDKYISVQLIIPNAFVCENNTKLMFLQKGQSADMDYCISKKDALPATTHIGYVLITYKVNTISYSQVTPFNIYVKPGARVFFFEKNFVAITCIFFGLIWVLFLTYVSFKKHCISFLTKHEKFCILI